jgi:hypothetical protein
LGGYQKANREGSLQQLSDFLFDVLAVEVSTLPTVDSARVIPQQTAYKSFGPFGYNRV